MKKMNPRLPASLLFVIALCSCASGPRTGERTQIPIASTPRSGEIGGEITAAQFRQQLDEIAAQMNKLSLSVISMDPKTYSVVCACSPSISPNNVPKGPKLTDPTMSLLKLLESASQQNASVEVKSGVTAH